MFFMPPTSEKLRGHIGLGLSVCPSVHMSVHNTWQLRNSRTAYARILKYICGMYMKNKQTRIFFSFTSLVVLELCPFFDYV